MPSLHLFEFMDQEWVPGTLRATLREILECGNSRPFRPYYDWVAGEVARAAADAGFENIVELGAGTGPITRRLAKGSRCQKVRLIVCDGNPPAATYRELEQRFPRKVVAKYEPVDFSQPRQWDANTLLVLSATFHHIRPDARPRVLAALKESADRVMVFEPLRHTLLSVAFVFLSLVPALLLPLWYAPRVGKLRRLVWCWLLPVAPLMFWWDGMVSCVRQWSNDRWRRELATLFGSAEDRSVGSRTFSQMIVF